VVPGAKVTITQMETNRRVTKLTRADGVYLATALPVIKWKRRPRVSSLGCAPASSWN
jgi:hypothetical protein